MNVPALRSLPWLLLGGFGVACMLGPGIDVPAKGDDGGLEGDGSTPTDDFGAGDDGISAPGNSGGATSGGSPADGGSSSGGAGSQGGSATSGGSSPGGAAGAPSDG